jgi:ribosomal protein S18 acetylase RimI-like enzyme
MNYELKENVIPSLEDLIALYSDAGWSNYTDHAQILLKAYDNSLSVITAWQEDKLIGAIRVVGDGYSIIYIQDIIVLQEYQHRGVGSRLFTEVMNKYKDVYQKVLLTDSKPETKAFYEKMGFQVSDYYGCVSYVMFRM